MKNREERPNKADSGLLDSAGSGDAFLFHCDDYLSSGVSRFDVTVRLGNLLQRIASINDRSNLPRLDELFEKD